MVRACSATSLFVGASVIKCSLAETKIFVQECANSNKGLTRKGFLLPKEGLLGKGVRGNPFTEQPAQPKSGITRVVFLLHPAPRSGNDSHEDLLGPHPALAQGSP